MLSLVIAPPPLPKTAHATIITESAHSMNGVFTYINDLPKDTLLVSNDDVEASDGILCLFHCAVFDKVLHHG